MAKNLTVFLSLIFLLLSFLFPLCAILETHDLADKEVQVGLVVDLSSMEGKIICSCISMALLDFYEVNEGYRTRVSVHTKDSNGDPLQALANAVDLLENERVDILIGAQSSLEAQIFAELGEKAKVPVISFHSLSSFSWKKYNYVVQVSHNESSEAEGIAAFINGYNWNNVALVYEDGDDWRESMELWSDRFQENRIRVKYKWFFSASSREVDIIHQLQEMKKSQNMVFVVHMSEGLMSRFFSCARRLGMLDEGYAWIVTANSMNRFHYKDFLVRESMQGVIGFKSHIPVSKELYSFMSRWRRAFLNEEPDIEFRELSVFGVWARDTVWSIAMAAETAMLRSLTTINQDSSLNFKNLSETRPSFNSRDFLEAISKSRFDGLSGNYQLVDRKLHSNAFEIMNIIGNSERRVGYWTSDHLTKNLYTERRQLSSTSDLETVIWPGGSATIPKGHSLRETSKKLRILVPASNRFPQLTDVYTSPITNKTNATGFCVEVFKTAMQSLDYELEYIPWNNGTYNGIAYALFLQKYDAAVGDITITANRSLYADFTLPFTDLGTGIVAPKDKNIWIFMKPLTADLWLTSALFFVLTGFLVWLIERPDNSEFQGSWSQQIGVVIWFGFSTLVFAHRERLRSNLSRFVVLVWIFSVLILTSNYTATLTSMMTLQQIRLKANADVGHLSGSYIAGVLNTTHLRVTKTVALYTPDDYAKALSKGSKNGGVSVIVDEIPYLRVFLGKYPTDFSLVKLESTSNGFGFMFQKGSPLVSKLSIEIAKLRESGKLQEMENKWFKSPLPYTTDDSSDPLTVYKFRGLFIITGSSFAFVLILHSILRLREHWGTIKNVVHGVIIAQLEPIIILYARMLQSRQGVHSVENVSRSRRSSNEEVQMTAIAG